MEINKVEVEVEVDDFHDANKLKETSDFFPTLTYHT